MGKLIVIGAGISGLACAARLAHQGWEVTLLESQEEAGGKVREIRKDGFRWDTGPSLFTLPEMIEELFEEVGEDLYSYLQYERLNEVCRYFFPDGTRLSAKGNINAFIEDASLALDEEPKVLHSYFDASRKRYNLSKNVFLKRSLHKASTFLSMDAFKAYPFMWRLAARNTLHRYNVLHFKNKNTVQLFDRFATYNGSNPYQAPATLGLISWLEHGLGAYYPLKGGMYAIVQALIKLCEKLGVDIRLNEKVVNIDHAKGEVVGVRTETNFYEAKKVVSCADVGYTYKNLLRDIKEPKSVRSSEPSTSALVYYWGLKGEHPELGLHNVLFSGNYLKEFHALTHTKTISDDPTLYLYLSCREETLDAPKGGENLYAMINVPSGWGYKAEEIKEGREKILNKIRNTLGFTLEPQIVSETCLGPQDLEMRTSAQGGSLYGGASNGLLSAFLRHPNFSSKLRGLYFAGGTVHPGGGIPLCLLSAKIVSELVGKVKD